MDLYSRIADTMRRCNAAKLAVVVNSQYLMHEQKMVYVRINEPVKGHIGLQFYITAVLENSTNREIKVITNALKSISDVMAGRSLYGVCVDGTPQMENCKVTVSNELGILVLESAVFCAVRRIAEQEKETGILDASTVILKFQQNGVRETPETVQKLLHAFKQNSMRLYSQMVYAGGNNRFINRLQKAYKFYTIQKSFIPVFINCNLFYDPLDDGLVHRTVMYHTALEKDRAVTLEAEGFRLTAFFLTHEEICRAFRMKHFMRFTPGFWYNFFIGMLYPNTGGDFPVLGEQRWYASKTLISGHRLKAVYTESEMAEQMKMYGEDPENKGNKELLEILSLYEQHDTLFRACQDAHAQLTSFGPVSLDTKEGSSVQSVYNYLSQAKMEFV